MTTVLVIGGAGYIGSHVAQALHERGYKVIVLDNLSTGNGWACKWGLHIHEDIMNTERIYDLLKMYKVDAVMHFAAFSQVGESIENPGKYWLNNVHGTQSLLEAMMQADVKKLIFSSTAATYGNPVYVPIDEKHPQAPINAYGRTKVAVEQMFKDYEIAHGLRHISLRYFNAAGADPRGFIGEAHDPESHLIPLVIEAAVGVRENIRVFGTDYKTADGTCIRDYIHVCDIADAHILALNALDRGAPSTAYNLSNGTGFSVFEVIRTVENVTGLGIDVVAEDRRSGDPAVLVGDSTKIEFELGWNPQYPGLHSIVQTAWDWHKQNG